MALACAIGACADSPTRELGGTEPADALDATVEAPDVVEPGDAGGPDLSAPDAGTPDASEPDADPADLGVDAGVERCPAPPRSPRRATALPPACAPEPDLDDIARSPRPDALAELMAAGLERGRTGVASEAAYARANRDLCRLRELDAWVADFERGFGHTSRVILFTERSSFDAMRDGTYEAWRCLHAQLGVEDISFQETFDLQVSLRLAARARSDALIDIYETLPGVEQAFGAFFPPSLEPRLACGFDRGDGARRYVLTRGGGDCPAGCTEWEARAYRVDDVSAALEASWDSRTGEGPPPEVTPAECLVSAEP